MASDPTTRAARRQTLAKLVLGHLIDVQVYRSPPRSETKFEVRRYGDGEYITGQEVRLWSEWPSEALCARIALALDARAYQSCAIGDLDEHTVESVLGDVG